MGRVKEWMLDEERIKFERAEAAYLALPEALTRSLNGIHEILQAHTELVEQNIALKCQIAEIHRALEAATSGASRWKERGYGLLFGVVASFIWARVVKQWPIFG